MAGWLKQGLSSLGEGISTLTKEILAEEPPDHHGDFSGAPPAATSSSGGDGRTSSHSFEALGARAEIERLRAMVIELEERSTQAEALANAKYQQVVRELESVTVLQRNEISQLQQQLSSHHVGGVSNGQPVQGGDADVFRDIDLFSSSPPPPLPELFPSRDGVSRSRSFSPDDGGRGHPHLSHRDSSSLDAGLVEALETELREKDSTIRHLTQEIARSKASMAERESVVPTTSAPRSEAEMQTEQLEAVVVIPRTAHTETQTPASMISDMKVQTETEPTPSSPTAETEVQTDQQEIQTSEQEIQTSEQETQTSEQETQTNEQADEQEIQTSEREIQTEEATPQAVVQLDQYVQSDENFALEAAATSAEAIDVATMCEIRAAMSDEGVQVDGEDTGRTVVRPETVTAEAQTELALEELTMAPTVDAGVQLDWEMSDVDCQTPLPQVTDQAIQQDPDINRTCTSDRETQSAATAESFDFSTQTVDEAPSQAKRIPTVDAVVQTTEWPTVSQETQSTQSNPDVSDRDSQSEITGDVILFQDYSRVVEENQALHSQLGTLTVTHDRSRREVDRLRAHLLTVEQGFEQDFQLAAEREQDLRELVQQLESQVAIGTASEAYHTNEVRASLADLSAQVRILTEARDLSLAELHGAEKRNGELVQSLSSLRLAVEHLKLEHRTESEQEKERARRNVRSLESQVQALTANSADLEARLAESNRLLTSDARAVEEAAAMAGQYGELLRQLDEKSHQLTALQEEVARKEGARVDAALMKNMLMGYLVGPRSVQADILRMMMATLNFDELERQKVQSNQTSTLRALFGSATSSPSSAGKATHETDDSFSNMLVKFIEQESKPKAGTAVLNGVPVPDGVLRKPSTSATSATSATSPHVFTHSRPLNSQRSFTTTGSAAVVGRTNTATDPSMAQDRMLEDILNGPGDADSDTSRNVDIV